MDFNSPIKLLLFRRNCLLTNILSHESELKKKLESVIYTIVKLIFAVNLIKLATTLLTTQDTGG